MGGLDQVCSAIDLLAYQREAVDCEARFTWNCWARQTGKSFAFSLRRLLRGLARRRTQIILSAGQRQSREVMEKVRSHCRALAIWHEMHGYPFFRDVSIRQLEIRLPGGVRIIGLPANPLTARGFTGDVFLDEFAMHRDDAAIWGALFPTLLRGEGELDVASTPRGQRNLFHRLRENPRFRHATLTLDDAVRDGLCVDVAAMRAAIVDEVAWRQEFCCEFADESTSFLTYELIRSCQDVRRGTEVDWEALRRPPSEIYAGVDVGRFRDATAVWLWLRQDEAFQACGLVTLFAAPFTEQEALIARLLDHRSVRRCCIDATGLGMPLAERLVGRYGEHRVEPVVFTNALKSELAARLRIFAERGRLSIPVDEAIVADWHAIARTTTSSGQVRLDADRASGGHGDRFWAAALGLHAAHDDPVGPGYLASGRLAFARSGVW